ncbi:MAG: hypothetical protein WC523_00010 [Patescibacteria group bacterium]
MKRVAERIRHVLQWLPGPPYHKNYWRPQSVWRYKATQVGEWAPGRPILSFRERWVFRWTIGWLDTWVYKRWCRTWDMLFQDRRNLLNAINDLLESADQTGCTPDLAVVEQAKLDRIRSVIANLS